MPFVPLLLLFLLYLQGDWPPAPFDLSPDEAIVLSLVANALVVLSAAFLATVTRIRLRLQPQHRSRILRTYSNGKFRLSILAVVVFIGCLYGLGWGWAMARVSADSWSLLLKPALLTPYLATMVLSWFVYYDSDRAAHEDFWGRGSFHGRSAYVMLHLRQNLLLFVPPLLVMVGQDALHQFVGGGDQPDDVSLLYVGLLVGLLAITVVFLPYVLRLILGLRPLPAGPVRDHLTATARRLGFRISDILVWNTRCTQANAMVSGMVPYLRYIVLTDRLLDELSIDEIEAVFGHEVGHIKHHHMPFYTLFLVLSVAVLAAGFQSATQWAMPNLADSSSVWKEVIERREWFLFPMVAYIFLCFGYMSRRCERQADLYGCHVAGFPAMIRALDKVADLNGISKERPGWLSAWQHGTMAERIEFLERTVARPELESTFQRRFGWLKWGSMASLVVVVGVLAACQQWEWFKYL
jgi:STE24 endopeptidase